jgi:hypothetical protein
MSQHSSTINALQISTENIKRTFCSLPFAMAKVGGPTVHTPCA